jgi:hypothetical protein
MLYRKKHFLMSHSLIGHLKNRPLATWHNGIASGWLFKRCDAPVLIGGVAGRVRRAFWRLVRRRRRRVAAVNLTNAFHG